MSVVLAIIASVLGLLAGFCKLAMLFLDGPTVVTAAQATGGVFWPFLI